MSLCTLPRATNPANSTVKLTFFAHRLYLMYGAEPTKIERSRQGGAGSF